MDEKKKIDGILEQTAEKLTGLVDVNTVVGKPVVTASGAQVIPLTKVTMGYLSGGGEYGEKPRREGNFAGGTGGGATLTPVGFLVIDRSGVRMIESGGALDKIADAAKNIADAFRGQ